VGSRPHFHTKRDEKGEIYQHKVQVVAKGYSQIHRVDYTDTYAPVARMESMRTILHIGATLDWEINQLDIKTAFLNGDLEEEVYMEQPEGWKEAGKEDWVYQLNKMLYGLKQAGRGWSSRLHREMVNAGFQRLWTTAYIFECPRLAMPSWEYTSTTWLRQLPTPQHSRLLSRTSTRCLTSSTWDL